MIFKTPKEMSDKTGNKHNRLTSYVLSASMNIEVWNDMYKSFTLVFRTIEVSNFDYEVCAHRALRVVACTQSHNEIYRHLKNGNGNYVGHFWNWILIFHNNCIVP